MIIFTCNIADMFLWYCIIVTDISNNMITGRSYDIGHELISQIVPEDPRIRKINWKNRRTLFLRFAFLRE